MNTIKFRDFEVICDFNHCKYFKKFPEWCDNAKNYENQTIDMIKYFSTKNSNFIDLGGWYGFMSIFASKYYKNIITVEADKEALLGLRSNIKLNKTKNVSVFDKVLYNFNGEINFGGNGEFGNAESTVLINDINYLTSEKSIYDHRFKNKNYILEDIEKTKCSDFNSFLFFCNSVSPDFIDKLSLIKMDIEGSEKIILPQMKNFFDKNKHVNLFISLHWIFLTTEDMKEIINFLIKLFDYSYDKNFKKITYDKIIENKIHDVLFTNKEIN